MSKILNDKEIEAEIDYFYDNAQFIMAESKGRKYNPNDPKVEYSNEELKEEFNKRMSLKELAKIQKIENEEHLASELVRMRNISRMEYFADHLLFRQSLEGLKYNISNTTDNLGTNKDIIDQNKDRNYLSEFPDAIKEIKEDFIQLKESDNLTKSEMKQVDKILKMIALTEKNLSDTDFTKNAIVLNKFDDLADEVLQDVEKANEKVKLYHKATELEDSKFDRELAKREKEAKQRAKDKEIEDLNSQYINTDIDLDKNPFMSMAQKCLSNYNDLNEDRLKEKVITASMRTQSKDQILASLNLNPFIYGRDVRAGDLFNRQISTNRKKYDALPLFSKVAYDLSLEFQATVHHMKRESKINPIFQPIGLIINAPDKLAVLNAEKKHKFDKAVNKLGERYLTTAGYAYGRAAILAQLKKQEYAKKVHEAKKDLVNKPKEKAVNLSKVIKESFDNLSYSSIVNVHSILKDARNGVMSPIVKEALDKTSKVKSDFGAKLVATLKPSNKSDDINKNRMTLNM